MLARGVFGNMRGWRVLAALFVFYLLLDLVYLLVFPLYIVVTFPIAYALGDENFITQGRLIMTWLLASLVIWKDSHKTEKPASMWVSLLYGTPLIGWAAYAWDRQPLQEPNEPAGPVETQGSTTQE